MSESLARRRELRKRKILENAEIRRQKIFGINSVSDNSCNLNSSSDDYHSKVVDDQDGNASVKSNESEISSRSLDFESSLDSHSEIMKLNDILRNIPDPLLSENNGNEGPVVTPNEPNLSEERDSNHEEESKCLNSLLFNNNSFPNTSSGSPSFLNSKNHPYINDNSSYILGFLEHPGAPCMLAVVVSLLISIDLANLVSNSLIIPFCIWEIQQIILSFSCYGSEGESNRFLVALLVVCGMNQNIIGKYIWICKLSFEIFQDFAVYIITIVIWQVFIGFPSILAND